MIKINKFLGSKGIFKLEKILNKRRNVQNTNISLVSKIIKDIKKNKIKAVIKYEKKFSNNNKIIPTTEEINKVARS